MQQGGRETQQRTKSQEKGGDMVVWGLSINFSVPEQCVCVLGSNRRNHRRSSEGSTINYSEALRSKYFFAPSI